MAEKSPFIEVKNISFSYDGTITLIEGLSAAFPVNSTTLLAGANGAVKTTLLKLLVGLLRPQHGSILVGGRESHASPLHEIAAHIAVSLQQAEYQMFLTTVKKEISFGPANVGRPNAAELAADAIELFALAADVEVHPYDMHPAKRKLLSLASAVAMDTPFLIFDEPTSGLSTTEKEIFSNALRTLRRRGKGYILITHDLSFGLSHCSRMFVLDKGKCVVDEGVADFLRRPEMEGLMRKAHARIPAASRISRMFDHDPVARNTEELVSLIRNNAR